MPTMIKVICDRCGKEFERELKRYNDSKRRGYKQYCSDECHRDTLKLKCVHCGKEVLRSKSQYARSQTGNVFCNRSCATSYNNKHNKVDEEHINFTNGAASYRGRAFRKYEHKCAICGYNEDERLLEVHHIDKNRANNNIENLIILCVMCHKKITLGIEKLDIDINKS